MFKLGLGFVIVAAIACGGSKPKGSPPPTAPAPDLLRVDLETFCSAEAATHATGWPELGPYLEPKVHDTDVKKAMFALRDGSLSPAEFISDMRDLATKEHVDHCPTLDKLAAPKPQ